LKQEICKTKIIQGLETVCYNKLFARAYIMHETRTNEIHELF